MMDDSPPPPLPPKPSTSNHTPTTTTTTTTSSAKKPKWMAQHSQPIASTSTSCSPVVTRSPTVTRSIQPAGTNAHLRMIERANSGAGTSSPAACPLNTNRLRSASTGSINNAAALSSSLHGRTSSTGRHLATSSGSGMSSIFCDVIVDHLESDQDVTASFLNSLGTALKPRIGPSEVLTGSISKPNLTPRKTPKVDLDLVRRMLVELAMTEESYYRKIKSLHEDFEKPLRKFSKVATTAIISEKAVLGLFSKLEYLVPIAEMFNADLQAMLAELKHDRTKLPMEFGMMIRHHVKGMWPFAQYLNDRKAADKIRSELEKSVPGFRTFIERQQVTSRERTQQTGGFIEFMAEPFQRISRYNLMLEPIIRHLPEDDPNLEALQEALDTLHEICSMPADLGKRQPAIRWALRTHVESVIEPKGEYITSLDVDETYDPENGSKPVTLRCVLWLFDNELIITKRANDNSKPAAELAGLNNLDDLVVKYRVHEALPSNSNIVPGSPSKKSRGGYRGKIDVLDIEPRSGGVSSSGRYDFALVLDPPPMDQSERWNGRTLRKYVVAATHSNAEKFVKKDLFLNRLAEAKAARWIGKGARSVRKGRVAENEIYWMIWERSNWERLAGERRGKLALYLDEDGEHMDELMCGVDGHPLEVAKASFLGSAACRFAVRSTRDSASRGGEIIDLERIPTVISELGTSKSMLDIPVPQPTTPGGSKRARSGLRDALAVFGGGSGSGSSSLLKGGNSTASRTSNGSTTTLHSGAGASTTRSPQDSPMATRERPRSGIFSKKSESDLQARKGATSTSESNHLIAEFMLGAAASPSLSTLDTAARFDSRETSVSSRRPPHRRSLSLPPLVQDRFDSTTDALDAIVACEVEEIYAVSRRRSRTEPEPDFSVGPIIPATPIDASWLRSGPSTSMSSPMDARGTTPRRRMMGPREPRSAVSSRVSSPAQPSESSPTKASYSADRERAMDTDVELSRVASRSSAYTYTGTTSETERAFETPSPTSTITGRADGSRSPTASALPFHISSTATRECPPSPLRHSISRHDSGSVSPPNPKRPLPETSPRASPAKKRPSLGDGPELSQKTRGPRNHSPAPNRPRFGNTAGSVSPANGSTDGTTPPRKISPSQIKIRSRRVTSGTSTIRGESPPQRRVMTPPQPLNAAEEDVFVASRDPARFTEEKRRHSNSSSIKDDFKMKDDDSVAPLERLKLHVQALKSKLSKDAANKENDRIVSSPGGLSRSPHTRNVAIKAVTPSSAFASSFAEGRLSGATIDGPALLKWTEQLTVLLEQVSSLPSSETTSLADSISPRLSMNGPSAAEFAMLEAERELVAAELAALKHEVSVRDTEDDDRRSEVDRLTAENTTLRNAYTEIIGEIEVLYEQFNTRLREVVLAMQVDPEIGVSDETYTILSTQLREAVVARSDAERDLRMARFDAERESKQKEEWKKILVEHGLLPS